MNVLALIYDIASSLLPFLPKGPDPWDGAPDKGSELQSNIYAARSARTTQKLDVLWRIGQPECAVKTATGTAYVLSDRQQALWDEYHQLEADDKALTKMEDDAMIEAGI